MSFHVFLSHNSKDKAAVRDLKQHLIAYSLKAWLDEDELRPGIPWQQLLEDGIRQSNSIAVLIGNDGLGPWEDEEMQAALRLAVKDKRAVIPVLLPGAEAKPKLPIFLENRTWVDLSNGFTKDGLDKFVWGITGEKPTEPQPMEHTSGARVDELAGVSRELQLASYDLLRWPDSLPDGEQLARPELDLLLALNERTCSTTAVIGDPGSGKSALLATLGKRLVEAGHPVLAIKADLLGTEVANEADLRDHLGLSDRPSVMLERLAAMRPTYLLIDQLDALAGYLDLRTGRLNALLNLVRRLGRTDNIHIVLSARRFEYEHDVRLKSISAESMELELPAWSEVLELLESKNIAAAGWPADAQQVLRSPQALVIYLQLEEKVRLEPLLSYQAMLDRLWEQRVLSGPYGGRRSKVATDLADQMADEESLWLPMARFDEVRDDVNWLVQIGLLTRNPAGSSVGFAHQTMFDHALARVFSKGAGRLSAFVLERQASIFCRPKVWAGLTYLRGATPTGYAEELSVLWNTQGLRRHLRFLLIEFLGQQRCPIDVEETLLVSAFDKPGERALVLRAIAGSSGWFERLKRGIITQAMTSNGPARDSVSAVLNAAIEFAPEGATDLILEHWLPTGNDDYRAWSVFENAALWSERMIEAGVVILSRVQIAPTYLDHLAGSLGVEQPRAALRLIRAALDRSLRTAITEGQILQAEVMPEGLKPVDEGVWRAQHDPTRPIKNLLDSSNRWDMLQALAEHAPTDMIEFLWPWFVAALEALDDLESDSRDRPVYALQYDVDFRFEGESALELPQPSIPSAFPIALGKLAAESPKTFRTWMSAAELVEFVPVHRLIAHSMRTHPEAYANDAHTYLLSDERRWSLGNIEDPSGTSTKLIAEVAPFWSENQIAAYVERIGKYRPAVPTDLNYPEGRRFWARMLRSLRLRLLRALPHNRRTCATTELVRSEERAIGDGQVGVTFSSYSRSPLMSVEEMARAKDDDVINAFKSLPDVTGSCHPKDHRKGGNIQLSCEFAKYAKDNPDRAIRLMGRFEPEFGERAAGSAIREMASTAGPGQLQDMIASLSRRGFDGDEFQSNIATAVNVLLDAQATIRPEVISILRDWLLATPPRVV